MDVLGLLTFLGLTVWLIYVWSGSLVGLLVVLPPAWQFGRWLGSWGGFIPGAKSVPDRPTGHDLFATDRPSKTLTSIGHKFELSWLADRGQAVTDWVEMSHPRTSLVSNIGAGLLVIALGYVLMTTIREDMRGAGFKTTASLWLGIGFLAEGGQPVWPWVLGCFVALLSLLWLLRLLGAHNATWRLGRALLDVGIGLVMFPFGVVYALYD